MSTAYGVGGSGAHKGYVATEAVTLYRAVKIDGEDGIDAVDTEGEDYLGVVQESASSGDATNGRIVDVQVGGVTIIEVGADLALFDRVRVGATGLAVAMAATTKQQNQLGILLGEPTANGDWVPMLMTPGVQYDNSS